MYLYIIRLVILNSAWNMTSLPLVAAPRGGAAARGAARGAAAKGPARVSLAFLYVIVTHIKVTIYCISKREHLFIMAWEFYVGAAIPPPPLNWPPYRNILKR